VDIPGSIQPFEIYASHLQFYIQDSANPGIDGDTWEDAEEKWRIAVTHGAVAVGTARYDVVEGALEIRTGPPEDGDLNAYNHVVEADLEVLSGPCRRWPPSSSRPLGWFSPSSREPSGRPSADHVSCMVPDPLSAPKDLPDTSTNGCHQDQNSAKLLACTYGNPKSKTRIAAVGDSKMGQWVPALQLLATQNDWRLTIFTKSRYGFYSATVLNGKGLPYPSCTQWNSRLLAYLLKTEKPDYVLTSQFTPTAVSADVKESAALMISGLRIALLAGHWKRPRLPDRIARHRDVYEDAHATRCKGALTSGSPYEVRPERGEIRRWDHTAVATVVIV
jgi:hypothetical protein